MASTKTKERKRSRGPARRASPRMEAAQKQLEQVTGYARGRVKERLDFQRGLLVSVLEDMAEGLSSATRRAPSPASQRMLETGERMFRGASSRLDAQSVEAFLDRTGQFVRQRPRLLLTGLLGAGLLAGRMFRASGAGDVEREAES
ncbi:hypothetical protein MVI01_56950 [Myxococcus virescens]|uniref:DUF883 domain-containing protein n=2 Tax=Myxococcus virescens TaxID=83456 RepID=A0A511HK19_9BACT|nr:hypothetical protein MVI01_56950 [Myxococcus virescens]SDE85560.1 hypothetical protein SAMN04488504_113108 [Myxococcus virescens]